MKKLLCKICKNPLVKNGRNRYGNQQYRCQTCKSAHTNHYNKTLTQFKQFLDYILNKQSQTEKPISTRTLRRHNQQFWNLTPLPPAHQTRYPVILMDGIHIKRKAVILIATAPDGTILAWNNAKTECADAWAKLMALLPQPDILVCDGGQGILSARNELWKTTEIQRCLFHVSNNVKRCTTMRPKLEAGQELYALALALLHVTNTEQAANWLVAYQGWCTKWNTFLKEKTLLKNGKRGFTHYKLVEAKNVLNKLINNNWLFTFLKEQPHVEDTIPRFTNMLEGGVNSKLRALFRDHRGMPLEHAIKMAYWYCYFHSPDPLPPAQILEKTRWEYQKVKDVQALNQYSLAKDASPTWGNSVEWFESRPETQINMLDEV